jgi:hypothetical protein
MCVYVWDFKVWVCVFVGIFNVVFMYDVCNVLVFICVIF